MQVATKQAVRRRPRTLYLAWGAWALYLVIAAATLGFQAANDPSSLWVNFFNALVLGIFATVGALIASRRPDNIIGWLFILQGILSEIGWFGIEYAVYGLITAPGSLPGAESARLFGIALRDISFNITIAPLLLLFPEGRLLSRRWRTVVWLFLVNSALSLIDVLLEPEGYETRLRAVPSPIGIQVAPGIVDLVRMAMLVTLVLVVAASVASVSFRFRRSKGDERQQLRWFAYAAFLALAFVIVIAIGFVIFPPSQFSLPGNLGSLIFSFAIMGFPISAGIAILKYRLYDIDLLINRTLVYVPLTAILAGIFAASISLSQRLFIALTGQASDAATVFTTLIVVAAFTPLKDRLQALVDRRFKEAPDPAKKLKAFSEQVRLRMFVVDVQAILRRLLEESVAAFEASGGAAYLETNGNLHLIHTAGEWKGEAALSLPLEMNGIKFGVVSLCARHNGAEYTAQDRTALQQAIDAVTGALMPVGRSGDQIAVIAPIIESPSG